MSSLSNFFMGREGGFEQRSKFSPEQQNVFNSLLRSVQGVGGGGAFGQAADYYRGLLANDSVDYQALVAPEMRQFQEEFIPQLEGQYGGLGLGGIHLADLLTP